MMDVEKYVAHEKELEHRGAVRAFYIVLAVYVIVNVGLFTIDMLTSGGPWFFWPLGGWGIGMIAFGLAVFVFSNPKERDYAEEQRIRDYLGKPPEATA